jgi:uncharacterized protein (DUF2252 family)
MLDTGKMTAIQELYERGRALREQIPRNSHAAWISSPSRPDPISILQEMDKDRLKQLLPIKYGRMLGSPFAFMRGAAAVMASDLATTPVTRLKAQLCGDAHLLNFGVFATPERKLVFDINDFDETYFGPWEWDLKRLATSAVVTGREKGFNDETNRKLAMAVNKYYRRAIVNLAKAPFLDVWYYDVEVDEVLEVFERTPKKDRKSAQKVVIKASENTQEHTMEKITELVDGKRRIRNTPPFLVCLNEAVTEEQKTWIKAQEVEKLFQNYLEGLPEEKRRLMSHFRLSNIALQIVGIESIGKRFILLLLEGATKDDALILQLKEAGPSVLEPYVAKRDYANQALRVVVGQKLMQAVSDIFLAGIVDQVTGIQYYLRQFKDMKGSFNLNSLDKAGLETYLKLCSVCLARAHARSGNAACISGYIGKSDAFCEAVTDFAVAYANQTEKDYLALKEAVKSGRIQVVRGL